MWTSTNSGAVRHLGRWRLGQLARRRLGRRRERGEEGLRTEHLWAGERHCWDGVNEWPFDDKRGACLITGRFVQEFELLPVQAG